MERKPPYQEILHLGIADEYSWTRIKGQPRLYEQIKDKKFAAELFEKLNRLQNEIGLHTKERSSIPLTREDRQIWYDLYLAVRELLDAHCKEMSDEVHMAIDLYLRNVRDKYLQPVIKEMKAQRRRAIEK